MLSLICNRFARKMTMVGALAVGMLAGLSGSARADIGVKEGIPGAPAGLVQINVTAVPVPVGGVCPTSTVPSNPAGLCVTFTPDHAIANIGDTVQWNFAGFGLTPPQ